MKYDLHAKAVRAGAWSLIEAICVRGLQFIVGIVLARLLLPEQFGLIGMLSIFIAVAQAFLDSGFGAALIQKSEISEKDRNSIFNFNIVIGLFVAGCLGSIAPLVADFYQQPLLAPLLRAMSLVLIVDAFGLVQAVLLTRAIDFKTQVNTSLVTPWSRLPDLADEHRVKSSGRKLTPSDTIRA